MERIEATKLLGRGTVRLVALQEGGLSRRSGRNLEDRRKRNVLNLVEGRTGADSRNDFGREVDCWWPRSPVPLAKELAIGRFHAEPRDRRRRTIAPGDGLGGRLFGPGRRGRNGRGMDHRRRGQVAPL